MPLIDDYKKDTVFSFKIDSVQKNTLLTLKNKYKINTSLFIRQAIKEKIDRDYKELKEKIDKKDCPF